MKKISLLLAMLMMVISGAWASIDTSKSYCLVEKTTGRYVAAGVSGAEGAFGLNASGTTGDQFTLTAGETEGTYTLATKSGKNFGTNGWNTADAAGTTWTVTEGTGDYAGYYTFYQTTPSNTGYLGYQSAHDPSLYVNCGTSDGIYFELKEVSTASVTYNFKFNGEQIATSTVDAVVGAAYPTPVLTLENTHTDAYTVSGTPEGTVPATGGTATITVTENLPFKVSTSLDDATWYTMTIGENKYYTYYEADSTSMALSRTTTTYADADLFCFMGNIVKGFTIYNKAAGEGKVLSSSSNPYDGNSGGSTYVTLQDKGTSGLCQTWDIQKSSNISGENGFYMAMHGLAANVRMNNRDGNLAFWNTGADAGSTFLVTELTESAAKTALRAAITSASAAIGTNPGYYSQSAVDDAQAVLDASTSTDDDYTTATTTLNNSMIMPEEGKVYQIVSALPGFETQQSEKKAMYANGTTMGWKKQTTDDASMYWTLAPVEGGYAMVNFFTNQYAGVQASQSATYPMSTEATVLTLTNLGSGQFNLKTTGSGYAMHAGDHSSGAGVSGNVIAWDGSSNSASAWYIVEGDEATATAAAKTTFATIQGHTLFQNVDDAVIVKAQEIGEIADINTAINAVNAIDPETATFAEMGACYAANAATINSLTAYGTLTDIVYTLKPGYGTLCLPCWGGWGTLTTDEFAAYTCSGLEDGSASTLALTALTEMNPKTPFIVENKTSDDITFEFIGWNKVTDDTKIFTSGLLTGTIAEMTAEDGTYVLQKQGDVTGFYQVAPGEEPTISAYHCYLTAPSTGARVLTFGGEATAISGLNANVNSKDGKFIQNGRMVIVKNGKKFNAAGQIVK